MKTITREKDIEKLNIEEQLKFYKNQFHTQHCELDGCGNEVHGDWAQYDGYLYCERCFDYLIEEEKEKARQEIKKCEKQIQALKERYDL